MAVVTVASRSAHSSAAFSKRPSEGVPVSSVTDRRIVVAWGSNEKSQLYVAHASLALWVLMPTRQP